MKPCLCMDSRDQYEKKSLFLIFIISIFVLVYLAFTIGLTEQEAYYWSWSKNIGWSYFDHPAMHAWFLALSTMLFGDSVFAVRIIPVLAHILTFVFLFSYIKKHTNNKVALVSVFLLQSTWFMAHMLFSVPDSILYPLSLLAIIFTEQKKFYIAAVFLGLAILTKWHAVLLLPGILYFFYKSQGRSKFFKNVGLFILIIGIFQLPTLYWNFENGWPSLKYHLIERHTHRNQSIFKMGRNVLTFIILQFFLIGPSYFYLFYKGLQQKLLQNTDTLKTRLIWISIFLFVFLISSAGGESRLYWTGLILLPLALLIADIFLKLDSHSQRVAGRIASAFLIFNTFILFAVLSLPIGAYFKDFIESKGYTYNLRLSPRGDFYGWTGFFNHLKQKQDISDAIFITPDFHITAKVMWVLKDTSVDRMITYENPHQYGFFKNSMPDLNKLASKKVILLEDNRYKFGEKINSICKTFTESGDYSVKLLGKEVKKITWYRCA